MRRNRIIIRDTDAQELREKGNQSFIEKNYPAAISYYTNAIKKSTKESILYSNRARCYYMIKDYINSLKDSEAAINLDNNNFKAHLLYIRNLGNLSKQSMNLTESELALKCCKSLYRTCSSLSESDYLSACRSLSKKLKALIHLKKREIRNYRVSRLRNYYKDIKNKRAITLIDKFLIETKGTALPDSLCCPITFEIFAQPVITECGNTYEANALVTHFSKMGIIDPITRNRINPHAIFKNSAILQVKDWFLSIEPWAKLSETIISSLDIEF